MVSIVGPGTPVTIVETVMVVVVTSLVSGTDNCSISDFRMEVSKNLDLCEKSHRSCLP